MLDSRSSMLDRSSDLSVERWTLNVGRLFPSLVTHHYCPSVPSLV